MADSQRYELCDAAHPTPGGRACAAATCRTALSPALARFLEQGLLSAMRQRKTLAVRVSGPMGSEVAGNCQLTPAPAWRRPDVLVLVCGGVGVTAMLGMLREMATQRAAAGPAGAAAAADCTEPDQALPRRVVCVWTARSMGEFQALDVPLLLAAA